MVVPLTDGIIPVSGSSLTGSDAENRMAREGGNQTECQDWSLMTSLWLSTSLQNSRNNINAVADLGFLKGGFIF